VEVMSSIGTILIMGIQVLCQERRQFAGTGTAWLLNLLVCKGEATHVHQQNPPNGQRTAISPLS